MYQASNRTTGTSSSDNRLNTCWEWTRGSRSWSWWQKSDTASGKSADWWLLRRSAAIFSLVGSRAPPDGRRRLISLLKTLASKLNSRWSTAIFPTILTWYHQIWRRTDPAYRPSRCRTGWSSPSSRPRPSLFLLDHLPFIPLRPNFSLFWYQLFIHQISCYFFDLSLSHLI